MTERFVLLFLVVVERSRYKCKVPKWNNCYHSIRTDVVGYEVDVYFGPIRHAVAVLYRPQIYIA